MGIDVSLGLGGMNKLDLGFQTTKGETDKLFNNGTRNIAQTNRIIALYQLDMMPGSTLSTPFNMMASKLPTSFNGEAAKRQYL